MVTPSDSEAKIKYSALTGSDNTGLLAPGDGTVCARHDVGEASITQDVGTAIAPAGTMVKS